MLSLVPVTALAATSPNPITMPNATMSVGEDVTIGIGPLLTIAVDDPANEHSMAFEVAGIPPGYTVGGSLTGATTSSTPSAGVVRFEGPLAADVVATAKSLTLSVVGGGAAAHSDRDFVLALTATTTKPGGSTHTVTSTHAVNVRAIADAPTQSAPAGLQRAEDVTIPFPITVNLVDTDGTEALQGVDVTITSAGHLATITWNTGLPGTVTAITNGQRFTGTTAQIQALLASVSIVPLANNGGDISVRVVSTSTESAPTEAGDVQTPTATTTTNHTIDIAPAADAPTIATPGVGNPYTGEEDTRIKLSGSVIGVMPGALTGALVDTDGSETLSFRITGLPTGVAFWNAASGGSPVGTNLGSGAWSFTVAQIAAGIFFQPATNYSGTLDLQFVGIATDTGGVQAQSSAAFRVVVDAQADQPTVSGTTIGNEDTAINFGVNVIANPADADGSEYVSSVTLSALPAGWSVTFTPNANVTVTGSGVGPYTLSVTSAAHANALQTVLDSFTVTPPAQSDANTTIQVSATSVDADGSTAVRSAVNHLVTVRAVADTPGVVAGNTSGPTNTAIDTDLSVAMGADTDGSETLSVRILDVPTTGALTANTTGGGSFVNLGGGAFGISGTTAQLNTIVQSIRYQPPANFVGATTMRIEVTSTEAQSGGEVASKTNIVIFPFTVTST